MLTAFFYNFLYKPIVGSEHCFEFVYFLKEGRNRQYLNCEFLDLMRIRPVWRPSAVEREGSKVIFATVVGTNVDGATWNKKKLNTVYYRYIKTFFFSRQVNDHRDSTKLRSFLLELTNWIIFFKLANLGLVL